MERTIASIVDIILRSRRIVVFTGAGVSTESGIQDFRSPGGLWGTPGNSTKQLIECENVII